MSGREAELLQEVDRLARALGGFTLVSRRFTEEFERDLAKKRAADLRLPRAWAERQLALLASDGMLQREATLQELRDLETSLGLWAAPWGDAAWRTYLPSFEQPVPVVTRFGHWEVPISQPPLMMPAIAPIIGGRNLLIEAGGADKTAAAGAITSLLLRLLATVAPGALRFLFVDPDGLGQNVATFMHLQDIQEELTHGKVWTEPAQIEQQLTVISGHMETVIQRYFRGGPQTMEEYNREAGEIAEPYRIVAVFDFPRNFTESAAHRLVSIATNGPRCGVYVVGTINQDVHLPRGFPLDDLRRAAQVVSAGVSGFTWPEAGMPQPVRLVFDEPPEPEEFKRIVIEVGTMAAATRVEVPFQRVAIPEDEWWTGSTLDGIDVCIGREKADKLRNFQLGQDRSSVHQALVAGRPGSGKSNLMHVLVASLALKYPPEELDLYLMDMKKGVEFSVYGDHPLPHVRVLAIGCEREFALSVLERLNDEMRVRGRLFTESGTQDRRAHRLSTGKSLPLILLIVDEFQELFSEDDSLAQRAALLLDNLVRQGRGFGIHLVLASQTLASHARTLPRSVLGLVKLRIAYDCSEDDSRLILSDDNPAASQLTRVGQAIYNSAGGVAGKGNDVKFQTAFLSRNDLIDYITRIQALARARGTSCRASIIFEHDRPVSLEQSAISSGLQTPGTWSAPPRAPALWLGEPISIRGRPTLVEIYRRPGCNLLVLGRQELTAMGLLSSCIVSLAIQYRPGTAEVFVLLPAAVDESWAAIPELLRSQFPLETQIVPHRSVPETMAKLGAALERRIQSGVGAMPPLFVVVPGLHRLRDLHRQERSILSGGQGAAPGETPETFARLLHAGPEVGMHVLAWVDTWANFGRVGDYSTLREFDLRIALPMSSADSNSFLEDHLASRLDPGRAYCVDQARSTREKFRPFVVPGEEWLRWCGAQLRIRT